MEKSLPSVINDNTNGWKKRNIVSLKKLSLTFFAGVFVFLAGFVPSAYSQSPQLFNASGTFTVPAGVTNIKVEVWGGGAGGSSTYGGGGGGAFAGNNILAVTSGTTYTISVGAGGSGSTGGNSSFGTLIVAEGGNGIAGGTQANSTGATKYDGGKGSTGGSSSGGGGGGSAGAGGAGGAASGSTGGAAGVAGSGTAGAVGGNGGANKGNGLPGIAPGAGGGQQGNSGQNGIGAAGRVIVYYSTITSFTPTNACANSGATITITGTNLTGATVVTFNGVNAASFTVVSSTSITAILPASATTGPIAVTTPSGTATSTSFTVNPLPTMVTVNGGGAFCGNATLTASNGSSGTMYFQGTTSNGTSTATPSSSQTVTTSGTYYFRAQSAAGCWGTQGSATVTINAAPAITSQPATTIAPVCQNNPSTALLVAATGTGLTYQWYQNTTASNTGGTAITGATATSYTPATSAAGTFYYYCIVSGTCPPAATSNVSGAVTINALPADVTVSGSGTFCGSATLTASNGGDGTIYFEGTTSNGTSTATPSASQVVTASGTYYFRALSASGCWGNQGSATVTINNTIAPTGTTPQTFCAQTNPTVADLKATGTAIQWYDVSTGGTALATSTPLVDGTHYYASQTASGCESTTRLNVTVTFTNPPAAPAGNSTQSFCAINNPTIANLTATGSNIQWYAAASGGTALASTTTLADGLHYYASQTSGCESTDRLDVTVTITNPAAPTGNASQAFCASINPTVADLAATGNSIQWYSVASGGTALSSSTALVSGSHYYASQTVSGCQSTTRFDVTVTINPLPTITTAASAASVCYSSAAQSTTLTYSSTTNNPTNYSISWNVSPANTFAPLTNAPLNGSSITIAVPAGTASGTYTGTITVQNANGCASTGKSFTVTVNAGSTAIISYPNSGYCKSAGGTATPNLSGTGTYQNGTYSASPTGLSITASTGVIAISNSTVGTYTVTYTLSGSCGQSVATTTVSIGASLSVGSFSMIGVATCSASGVELQSSGTPAGGNGTYTYQWQTNFGDCGAGSFSNIAGATSSTYIVPAGKGGDCHQLVVSSGGCSLTSNKNKPSSLSPASPTINFGTSVTTICINSSTTLTAQSAVSYTYAWSPSTGLTPTTGASVTANPTASTTYTVTGTATSGPTCSRTATVTVTVNPLATLSSVNASAVCSGTNTTVTLNGLLNNSTSTVNYTIGSGSLQTISGIVSSGTGTGTFQIPVTYANNGQLLTITSIASSINSGPACSQAFSNNNTTKLTVNPVPTVSNQQATTCSGSAFTVTPSGSGVPNGTKYTWSAPAYSGSFTGGSAQNTAQSSISQTLTLTGTNPGTATYTVTPTSGSCTGTNFTVTVTVTANMWNGLTSNWNDANNWCSGVPTAATDVVIPAGVPYYPTLTATSAVRSLEIQSGAAVTLGGKTLSVYGNVSGAGEFAGSTASGLIFSGTNTSTLNFSKTIDTTTNALSTLTVNSGTVTIGSNQLYVTDTLALNGGTFNTGGKLTLRSTSISNTARVAPVGNSAVINGNVTVERFIPKRRAYRFISPSVTTTTSIKANWMEGGVNPGIYDRVNPHPGFGTNITGRNPGTNGFDATITTNPSLYRFNAGTQKFDTVPNTSGILKAGEAYSILIRGDRSTDMTTNTPDTTNTILRATGTLFTGPYSPALSDKANGYTFIGNPYTSPIDFSKMLQNSNNVSPRYYVWDPSLNTRGAYVSWNGVENIKSNPASDINKNIQPGQAVFVQTRDDGSASIGFKEDYKSTGNTRVFGRDPSAMPKLSIQLLLSENEAPGNSADGAVSFFSKDFSTGIGDEDSYKLTNSDENLAINRNGISLSIEGRPAVTADDTIPLQIWQFRQKNYYLKLAGSNFSPELTAFVKDSYLRKETPVDLSSVTLFPFTIDTVPASSAKDRFSIVFKSNSVLPVTLTNIKAYQREDGIQVDWTAETETNIESYEVEKSTDGQTFSKATGVTAKGNNAAAHMYSWLDENPNTGSNYYRIKVIEKSGMIKYSNAVKVDIANVNSSITVFPNPIKGNVIQVRLSNMEKGRYSAVLYNTLGQKLYGSIIEHINRSGTYTISVGRLISKGTYALHVSKGDIIVNERVIVE